MGLTARGAHTRSICRYARDWMALRPSVYARMMANADRAHGGHHPVQHGRQRQAGGGVRQLGPGPFGVHLPHGLVRPRQAAADLAVDRLEELDRTDEHHLVVQPGGGEQGELHRQPAPPGHLPPHLRGQLAGDLASRPPSAWESEWLPAASAGPRAAPPTAAPAPRACGAPPGTPGCAAAAAAGRAPQRVGLDAPQVGGQAPSSTSISASVASPGGPAAGARQAFQQRGGQVGVVVAVPGRSCWEATPAAATPPRRRPAPGPAAGRRDSAAARRRRARRPCAPPRGSAPSPRVRKTLRPRGAGLGRARAARQAREPRVQRLYGARGGRGVLGRRGRPGAESFHAVWSGQVTWWSTAMHSPRGMPSGLVGPLRGHGNTSGLSKGAAAAAPGSGSGTPPGGRPWDLRR
jgi:hypothetical protein